MAFIIFFFFCLKKFEKVEKLILSPQKFHYGVLHLLYSVYIITLDKQLSAVCSTDKVPTGKLENNNDKVH